MGDISQWLYENMQSSVCFHTVNMSRNHWLEHDLYERNKRLSDIEQSIEKRVFKKAYKPLDCGYRPLARLLL